ncbi:hypothetical protein MTO96_034398 [Rhipicephalus appendiculatus]
MQHGMSEVVTVLPLPPVVHREDVQLLSTARQEPPCAPASWTCSALRSRRVPATRGVTCSVTRFRWIVVVASQDESVGLQDSAKEQGIHGVSTTSAVTDATWYERGCHGAAATACGPP